MHVNGTYVAVKLRPGRMTKVRVAPVAVYDAGVLIVGEQVEFKRKGDWFPASSTWQAILAFEGRRGVEVAAVKSGAAYCDTLA